MDLIFLTVVLIALTAVLAIVAILSFIGAIKLTRATNNLSEIQLIYASASLATTIEIPKSYLTNDIKTLEDKLKNSSPRTIRRWSWEGDNLKLIYVQNQAASVLNLLQNNAQEPGKIKEGLCSDTITRLIIERK